jgi:hypothetical protein
MTILTASVPIPTIRLSPHFLPLTFPFCKNSFPFLEVGSCIFLRNALLHVALQPFKAYCAICVTLSNFLHQASARVSPRESTKRRKVELWVRNVR